MAKPITEGKFPGAILNKEVCKAWAESKRAEDPERYAQLEAEYNEAVGIEPKPMNEILEVTGDKTCGLTIELTPVELEIVEEIAKQKGMSPEILIKHTAIRHIIRM